MAGKPSLELQVEIADASGVRFRLDSNGPVGSRPQGINFSTKRGDGFATGGFTLTRQVDRDWWDINPLDEAFFVGVDGSVAYEGRLFGAPRSIDDSGHSIALNYQGWMSHATDRKFTRIYVDKDLSAWEGPSRTHRAALLTASYNPQDFNVAADDSGIPSLNTVLQGPWNTGQKQVVWAVYNAGDGPKIASFYYDFVGFNAIGDTDFNWRTSISANDDRTATNTYTSGDQQAATGSGFFTATTAERYAFLQFEHLASVAGGTSGVNYEVHWRKLAVYGDHGLTKRGADPGGFFASDVITNIAQNWCPKLNTSGVQATTYAIPHLVFKDPIAPYDAFLEINKYHLWDIGVWENKTLTYEPYDLRDYDWELRTDDPGVTVQFQGDEAQDLFNGICANFTDVLTGRPGRITPDSDSSLLDTNPNNPANQHGYDKWDEASITTPTTAAGAAAIARLILAEKNLPKAPGTYSVKGHIRDRQGHWQPVWKVRAGQRIAITSSTSISDRPRLIIETNYTHDGNELQIGVEGSLPRVDAVLDRFSTELQARNLI